MAARAVPSMLPAPPTFSMMIGCLITSDMRWPSSRASASVGPPAANGTTSVIARSGNAAIAGEIAAFPDQELANVQVLENGKLMREVLGQTQGLAAFCYYFAGAAEHLHGDTVSISVPDTFNYTIREPIGVIAAVTPWTSPLALLFWKLCPALAAGTTMVVKPSEITPVSTLVLAELIEKAGFATVVLDEAAARKRELADYFRETYARKPAWQHL